MQGLRLTEKTKLKLRRNKKKWEIQMSLYKNINAKKARIKAGSGETMKKAGQKGRPTAKNFKNAAKTAKKKK
tara:strand:+ start:478 stop:693 length:216 start_codon:yes stop_codon:yes gene_type:complete